MAPVRSRRAARVFFFVLSPAAIRFVLLGAVAVALVVAVSEGFVRVSAITNFWPPGNADRVQRGVIERLEDIFRVRAMALVASDPELLRPFYDTTAATGQHALEREIRRIEYVTAWAERRGVRLVLAETAITLTRMDVTEERARGTAIVSLGLGYVYRDDPTGKVERFGIGTRQQVELTRRGDGWVLRRDDYTDPLDEDTLIPHVEPAGAPGPETACVWGFASNAGLTPASLPTLALGPASLPPLAPGPASYSGSTSSAILASGLASGPLSTAAGLPMLAPSQPSVGGPALADGTPGGYDRIGAVHYANRYCGAAWGCGENGQYHSGYWDYNGQGGDCTNFVSQALGDPTGGKLAQDRTWYYRDVNGPGGSVAWVQTRALIRHLTNTGQATVIGRGTYEDVMQPTAEQRGGLMGLIRPGDIIGYEEKGSVEHLAIVVDIDHRGYVLVNSHTADRYRVPWDLGWDKSVVYWLVQMHD